MCWENLNAHSWGCLITPQTLSVPCAAQDCPCSAALTAALLVPRVVINHVLANCQICARGEPKQWHTLTDSTALLGGGVVLRWLSTDQVLHRAGTTPRRSLSITPCSGGKWGQWCGHWSCQLPSGTDSWGEHLWVNRTDIILTCEILPLWGYPRGSIQKATFWDRILE